MNVREPDGEPEERGRDDTSDPPTTAAADPTAPDADAVTPGDLDDASVDAAFADIVAWWKVDTGARGDTVDSDTNPPAVGSVGESAPAPPPTTPAGRSDRRAENDRLDRAEALRRERQEREIDFAVDGPGGGHYVPPEPAKLPRLDVITLLAWVAVLVGPLLLLLAALLESQGVDIPDWVVAVAVAATIVGFVVLASRLPRRDEQNPDDDGAVV